MTSFPRRPQPLAVFVIILVVVSLACSLKLPQRNATPVPAGLTPGESSAPAGTPTDTPTATPPPVPLPPALLESDPLPGAEIPLAAPIVLRFNQPMERASVEAALHNSAGLVGDFAWTNDATVSFQPAAALPPATSLTFTVEAQAQSKKGMKMLSPVDIQFQTAGYLELAQTLPDNGAVDVDPASAVVAAFNHPVVALGADPANLPAAFTLEPALSGRGEWVNTSTYIFYPELSLGGGVTYVVRLNPSLQSTDGGPLDQALTEWTFSVALPYPQTFEPIDTALDVALDTAAKIVFNQSMDAPSTQANFKLLDEQLQPVDGQFGWDEKFTTLYFTPTQLLARNATYTVQLLPGAASAAGMPLNLSYQASWITVPSFFVTNTEPQSGGSKRNFDTVTVSFSSLLPVEGALEPFFSVTPAVTNLYISADYTGKQVYLGGDFKPETDYTVRIDSSLRDRWGAPLGQPYEFSFYNSSLDPEVYVPVSTDVIFLTPADGALPAQVANLSQIPINVGSLPLVDFIRMIGPEGYSVRQDYVPANMNSWSVEANAPGSQFIPVSLPLVPDGSELTPGLYFMRLQLQNIYAGPYLLVVSNIQVTYKVSATEAFVWAVDLRSDTSVGSLPVTIYLEDGQVLVTGETNADGVFRSPIPTRQDPGQTTLAMVGSENTDNFGLALSNWDQMVSPYNFGISLDDRAPRTQTYIYTDRPIYRPGHTVYFRMIARRIENGRYYPADQSQLQVKVFDNTGTEVNAFDLPLSGLGTASGEFVLNPNAQPGYYRLEAGEDSLQFIVAEYRKPEINLAVTLSPGELRYGETLQGLVDAQYFFGAPASGVKADWTLYARSDVLSLPGFNIGVENQNWLQAFYFPEGMFGGLGSQIASGSAVTGPDGQLALGLPTTIERDWLADTSPLMYTLEVTLTDESGQPVSARAEARVHREDYYIGVRPDVWVAQANQETGYQVQVVDWNAKPAGELSLRAEYRKVTWIYQRADDRYSPPEPVAEYTPVASVDFVTSPEGTARLAFTPTEPGTFELRITGGAAATTLTQWVGGPGQPVWPNLPNQRLRLTSDRDAYIPGNTAQVFIPNPFGQPALALVTLERAKVMQYQVVTLPANGNTLPFLLTDEHAPNIYLSVLLLGRTSGGAPDFRLGYINLTVAPFELVLNVDLTVQPDRASPGDEVAVNVRVTDSAGLPVQGEFSLAVVDLAVLKLVDPFALDIDQAFYGRQPLGVRMGLSLAAYGRRDVWTPGGMGGGGDEGISSVREKFPDTAYWNPSITTNANGEAALTLTLPDSLTTWQLDLRGITADNRVGQASAQLITSKDLLVRPVTPRFVVVGDRVQLAAIVQNNTASDLPVEAALQSDGLVLEGAASQSINVPANGRLRVEWWGTVQDVESLDLVFSARSGKFEDASRAADGALPVLRYRAPQAFATAGVLDAAGEQLELVSLPPNTDLSAAARAGGLHLQLSPSLGAAAYDALQVLNNETYACTEQVLSRLLGNLSTLQAARTANLGNAALETDLQQAVLQALSLLVSRQELDGGWGWWANETSDVHITAYALMALVQARQAGFTINEYSLTRGLEYLDASLVTPDQVQEGWQLDRMAFVDYARMLAGVSDPDRAQSLYAERSRMSPWALALLGLTLDNIAPGSQEAATLFSDLQSGALRSGSGANWEDTNGGYRNMASAVSTTSIVAYALVQHEPGSALLPDALRYLMLTRQPEGGWRSTYDTAWTLQALNAWVQVTGELQGSFTYGASLNGVSIASSQAGAGVLQSETVNIPLNRLYPNDPNALAVQHGEGAGRLYYTALLDVSRPVADVAPLNRGLVISREFYLPGASTSVKSASLGDQVTVRLRLVVPHEAYYVVIEDYIPAGAEVLNLSLKTSKQGFDIYGNELTPGPEYDPADPFAGGWGWWLFGSPLIYDERIAWTASYLPAGTYELTYRLTTLQLGEFHVLPARAYQFYFPDVQGNSAGATFTIQP